MSGSKDDQGKAAAPESGGESERITIDPGRTVFRVFACCLFLEITLVCLDLAVIDGGVTSLPSIQKLFDLEREDGLGNWLASVQTLLIGITL